ncbi:hypothetical protein ACN2XU_17120 [Primorskyibacter sp. 2E107]|uniref:hypothetical protein n=1 Tax=Primorskyibacter sp. 2E107 TaxID=3403458 RepID=UPI003AF724DE
MAISLEEVFGNRLGFIALSRTALRSALYCVLSRAGWHRGPGFYPALEICEISGPKSLKDFGAPLPKVRMSLLSIRPA